MKNLTADKCREWIDIFSELEKDDAISIAGESHLQAYRIALPILEQQERDEWIEWEGSDDQPDITPKLQIKRRDGVTDDGYLNHFEWDHIGDDTDIIAYRIIPEQPTNQNGEQ